nr:MAG TPA: hypothetical protein [Caudoviricetes sp.]
MKIRGCFIRYSILYDPQNVLEVHNHEEPV